MSSPFTSRGFVFATVMAVSAATAALLFFRQKHSKPTQKLTPKSCISSGRRKVEVKKKQKKRVRFADDVMKKKEKLLRRKGAQNQNRNGRNDEIAVVGLEGFLTNRAALYAGILRDRMHKHTMHGSY